jgi:negative regulator of genetic competence, sporulation and motility
MKLVPSSEASMYQTLLYYFNSRYYLDIFLKAPDKTKINVRVKIAGVCVEV